MSNRTGEMQAVLSKQGAMSSRTAFKSLLLVGCMAVTSIISVSATAAYSASAVQQDSRISEAQALADKGDYESAVAMIKSLEESNSDNIDYFITAAQILLDSANGEDAVNYVIKARNAGANFDRTALLLAKSYLVQRQFRLALTAVKDVKFLERELYDAALVQADAYLSLKERQQAEMLYRQAMNRDKQRYEAYLGLSRMALQVRQVEDAEGFARVALEKAPNETMVHYTLGLVQRYRGEFDEAKVHFNTAIDLFESNSLARLERAGILINAGDIAAAEADLDVVYANSPNNQMAFYLSAVILARQGKYEDADLLLERARSLVGRYMPATYVKALVSFEKGNYSIAEVYLKQVLAGKRGNIQLTRLLAITYLRQDKYKQANATIAPYLKTSKGQNDPVALNLAGIAQMGVGNVTRGVAYFEKAVELGGDRVNMGSKDPIAEIQGKLGMAKYAAGQVDAAVIELEKSAASGSLRDLAILATVYLRENKLDDARRTAQELVTRYPRRATGYNVLGTVFMAQKRYVEAIRQFEEAIRLNPDYVTAQRNVAICYLQEKKYAEAEIYLAKVAETVSNDYRLNSLLAKSMYEQGKYKQALPLFRQAHREMANAPDLTVDFADTLLREGNTEEAMQVAQRGTRTYANKPETLKKLGLVLMKTGDVMRATQIFARVVAFQPQDVDSQLLYARSLTKARLYTGARNSFNRLATITADRDIQVPGLTWYQAELEFEAGRLDRVEFLLPALQEKNRPDAVPPHMLGAIYNRLKRYSDAEKYLSAAYEKDSNNYLIIDNLVDSKMAQNKEQDSLDLLRDYLDGNASALQPRIKMAEIFKKQGQVERAINSYQAVFDQGIIDADIAAKMSRLLIGQNNYKAETMVKYAIDNNPRDPYAMASYGLFLLQVKRSPAEALVYFKKASARAPRVAENHYFMGLAFRRMNANDDAIKAFKAALNLSADFEGAADARKQLSLIE